MTIHRNVNYKFLTLINRSATTTRWSIALLSLLLSGCHRVCRESASQSQITTYNIQTGSSTTSSFTGCREWGCKPGYVKRGRYSCYRPRADYCTPDMVLNSADLCVPRVAECPYNMEPNATGDRCVETEKWKAEQERAKVARREEEVRQYKADGIACMEASRSDGWMNFCDSTESRIRYDEDDGFIAIRCRDLLYDPTSEEDKQAFCHRHFRPIAEAW